MRRLFGDGGWRSAALALGALAALAFGGAAQAAGTAAGTSIGNKATLSYSVGNVTQSAIGSSPTGNSSGTGTTTTFVVDNKINLLVTTSDAGPVSAIPGQTAVTATFVVSNTGNNTQDFALSLADLAAGTQAIYGSNYTDNFDVTASSCSLVVGAATQAYIVNLAPDATQTVKVVCPIPTGRLNNDLAGLSLTAEARQAGTNGATTLTQSTTNDPNAVDIVFADGAGSDDSARDAKSSARGAYRISTAALSITKTFTTVCDPYNGGGSSATNIPGGYVQYTVAISNSASAGASAILTQITDTLSPNVTFDPDLIAGTGSGANCAAGISPTSVAGSGFKIVQANRPGTYPKYQTSAVDSDGAGESGGTITVDFSKVLPAEGGYAAGELKAGETVQVIYQVKIN